MTHVILLGFLAILQVDHGEFLQHVQSWHAPEYPRQSVSERHSGVVAVTVDVDATGHVSNISIVSSPDVHMSEAVKTTVSQWAFRPFTAGAHPTPAESKIYIEFRLQPMGPNVIIPGLTKEAAPAVKDPFKRPDGSL
jgi:TonB family protein